MGIRVLVAAANGNRERVTGLLRSGGAFTLIAEAGDGVTAVRLAERHQPDLVIIEAELPELGGIEATAPIRSRAPAATIVVLTPSAGGRLAMRAGADCSVPMASSDSEILDAVHNALPVELSGHGRSTVRRR